MKKKILLIEDSQLQLKSIELTLSRLGHEVLTATNAIDGIEIAYQTFPDLIISDIIMPEINGYQLCRLLKNDDLLKKIPVILLTQLNEKLDNFWGIKAGADSFITKSDDPEEFLAHVKIYLENSPVFSEAKREEFIEEKKLENKSLQTKINNLLDQSLIESTIINEFRNLSEFIYATKILSKEIFSLIFSLIDYNAAAIFFNERDDKKKKSVNLCVQGVSLEDRALREIKENFFSTTFGDEYHTDESNYEYEVIDSDNRSEESISSISMFKSKIVLPITYANKTIGAIALYHKKPAKFDTSRILEIILQELKVLMRIKWLYSETKYLAITDGLTGLYNRRYFQQTLDREFARSKRYKSPLSIAMFDIDHFKNINDTYGHQFGDQVIAEISKIIRNSLRKTDYVARYGGEEIVLILPETPIEQTMIPIERIRIKIQDFPFVFDGKSVKVTASCGLAGVEPDVVSHEDLLLRTDKALYESKSKGRNRTTIFYQP
jgi:diguanylate cyclase (GGDEF)-like protein